MNKNSNDHIISIMVDNEPGVLARVVGLFSGRGYNIQSLSVSEVDSDKFLSRITIVTSGTKVIIDQIKAQLLKLIPVHNLVDLSEESSFIGKELVLVKVENMKKNRKKTFDIANKYNVSILNHSKKELILEMVGTPIEITIFLKKIRPVGIIEITRSGLVSMSLGRDYIKKFI